MNRAYGEVGVKDKAAKHAKNKAAKDVAKKARQLARKRDVSLPDKEKEKDFNS